MHQAESVSFSSPNYSLEEPEYWLDLALSLQEESRRKAFIARTAGRRQLLAPAVTFQQYLPRLPSSYPGQHQPAFSSALFLHPAAASSCHPLPWPVLSHQQRSCRLQLW